MAGWVLFLACYKLQLIMQDLTKILKVGNRVWSIMFGEGVVVRMDDDQLPIYIRFEGDDVNYYFDKYGCYEHGGQPQLYPIDQRPEIPAPQWPKVFEIQGEVYKEGEWVAVSDDGEDWYIERVSGINGGLPITDKPNSPVSLLGQHIRKLASFNNPDNT